MWNYGKKSQGRPFKKGSRPRNTKPVGSERVSGSGFTLVKVAQPDCWRPKHLVLWEKAYGPLPDGCKIAFIDGDRQNVCLENLKLVPTGYRIGDERLGSKGLIEVRVSPRRWRLKHLLVWEAAHGPLPKTHALYFVDGDRSNCALGNLFPFPKNGRLTAVDLCRFRPGSGLEALELSLGLMARLKHRINCRAATETLKIGNAKLLAQLEYSQILNGGPNVPYRH